jgi:lipoprotein-anchoring transpeptidase ErfK/SrfK
MARALAARAVVLALLSVCPVAARAAQEHGVSTIAIVAPAGESADAVAFAALPERGPLGIGGNALPPAVTLTLEADLTAQRLTVREGDDILYVWAISSGRRGYTTPTGTFSPAWMAKSWHSRQYDNAPMPHAVFFNRGVAFHATTAVSMLGRPASHGCVRLAPSNAARLYALVRAHGLAHTKVVVHGAPKFDDRTIVARKGAAGTRSEAALGRQRGNRPSQPRGQPVAASQWYFFQ